MMFQKRIDRAFKFQKEQANARNPNHENEEKLPLEKGDFFALAISALLVFSPIFIVLIGILFLAFKLMM